jgi:chromatin structure-remodeling complex subunit SFH1
LPLIAHAIHEELIKHKKDAIEWGVIGGDKEAEGMKDKTGLGMGWGRTKGPKVLQSVWREWTEAEEFRTRFEVLTAEEVERREIEKERASRCEDAAPFRITVFVLMIYPLQAVTT